MLYNNYSDSYPWFSNGTTSTISNDFHYCSWCGSWHTGTCPRVKAIEYYLDGSIKRVKFHDEDKPIKDESKPVKLAYICDEWREVKDDYPPMFYGRVIDEVVKKLSDCSRLTALAEEKHNRKEVF